LPGAGRRPLHGEALSERNTSAARCHVGHMERALALFTIFVVAVFAYFIYEVQMKPALRK
jgi:hypothetical protein